MANRLPSAWSALSRQLQESLSANRRGVDALLKTLGGSGHSYPDLSALLGAAHVDRGDAGIVSALVSQHQAGAAEAGTIVLLSRLPMLVNVSRHCHVDTVDYGARFDEQMHAAVAAFFVVLNDIDPEDEYLVHNLYWKSLHRVTDRRLRLDVTAYDPATLESVACGISTSQRRPGGVALSASPSVHFDTYDLGSVLDELLATAARRGTAISDRDASILRAVYGRSEPTTVAEAAEALGISEHAAESRLRRATTRLRQAVADQTRAAAQAA